MQIEDAVYLGDLMSQKLSEKTLRTDITFTTFRSDISARKSDINHMPNSISEEISKMLKLNRFIKRDHLFSTATLALLGRFL